MSKRILFTGALCFSLRIGVSAHAEDEHNAAAGLTAAGAGLDLRSTDPAAFVDIGNRFEGEKVNTSVYNGAAYYLANTSDTRLQQNFNGQTSSRLAAA